MAEKKKRAAARPAGQGGSKGRTQGAKAAGAGAGKASAGSAKSRSAAKGGGSARAAKGRNAAAGSAAAGSARVRDRARLSEKMGRDTRVRLFFQSTVPDFLLVLVLAAALSYTVSYGFHSAWDYRSNPVLVAALTVPPLLALFVSSWSKKALGPSIVAFVAVSVVMLAVAGALSPDPLVGEGGPADTAGNYVIFVLIVIVVALVSFLLSRRTAGLVFLLAGAIVACGLIQFLYPEWMTEQPGIPATLLIILAAGMLFIYHCYKQSVYSANRVKRTSFAGATGFSALIALACVLVGLGVFYGVVQASGLTTPDIKLFEEYVSPPVDENADDYELTEEVGDETSSNTDDTQSQTNQEGDGASPSSIGDVVSGAILDSALANVIAQATGLDLGSTDDDGDETSRWIILQITSLVLAILAILAVVAVILLQRYRRTWRLKRIASKSNAYQAWFLYTFLLGRLRRLRIRKPAQLTPLEFAVGFSRAMVPFTRDADGVDFVEVSSAYQDAVFGGLQPSDEELDRVKGYYRAFFKNARKYVGWPKWILWKFWRI